MRIDARCAPALLALRELLGPTRLAQTNLLAFALACVRGHQAGFREHRLEGLVIVDQRTGDAVAPRARLPGLAAAADIDHHVEARDVVGEFKRLANHHPASFTRAGIVDRAAV